MFNKLDQKSTVKLLVSFVRSCGQGLGCFTFLKLCVKKVVLEKCFGAPAHFLLKKGASLYLIHPPSTIPSDLLLNYLQLQAHSFKTVYISVSCMLVLNNDVCFTYELRKEKVYCTYT